MRGGAPHAMVDADGGRDVAAGDGGIAAGLGEVEAGHWWSAVSGPWSMRER